MENEHKTPTIIARCQRCGRGFIDLCNNTKMIDGLGDPKWLATPVDIYRPACGGNIVMLAEQADHAA